MKITLKLRVILVLVCTTVPRYCVKLMVQNEPRKLT
eukprot:SAG11_NODE_26883_length_339_cov_2.000000_1_plen_35_part_10